MGFLNHQQYGSFRSQKPSLFEMSPLPHRNPSKQMLSSVFFSTEKFRPTKIGMAVTCASKTLEKQALALNEQFGQTNWCGKFSGFRDVPHFWDTHVFCPSLFSQQRPSNNWHSWLSAKHQNTCDPSKSFNSKPSRENSPVPPALRKFVFAGSSPVFRDDFKKKLPSTFQVPIHLRGSLNAKALQKTAPLIQLLRRWTDFCKDARKDFQPKQNAS